jgi:hypothetical protein
MKKSNIHAHLTEAGITPPSEIEYHAKVREIAYFLGCTDAETVALIRDDRDRLLEIHDLASTWNEMWRSQTYCPSDRAQLLVMLSAPIINHGAVLAKFSEITNSGLTSI